MGKFKNQIPILYARNTHRVHRLTYFQIVMDKFIGLLTVIFMFPKVLQNHSGHPVHMAHKALNTRDDSMYFAWTHSRHSCIPANFHQFSNSALKPFWTP